MDENKSITDEQAKGLLMINDLQHSAIKKIRGLGYARYIGWIIAIPIAFVPMLLKADPIQSYLSLLFGLILGLIGQQQWNEKRFDALVDFMEKEGLFHKQSRDAVQVKIKST